MIFDKIKKNKFTLFLLIFYLFSIIYIKEIIFLFYNSTESPDFFKYFKFFEFIFGIVDDTQSEQGFFYYDFHSYYFYLRNFNFSSSNFFIFISKSIQELNTIFFLIGSLGMYRLLKIFGYNNVQILTSLILLNFMPITIAFRIVLKPEVLVFAFLPWLIVCYEKFIRLKNLKYLYLSIPLLITLISQKGSITFMIIVFLLIFYFPKMFFYLIRNQKKHLYLISSLMLIIFYLVLLENSSLNNRNFFDLQSGSKSEEKYDNKGKVSLFYYINPEKLIFYPYKHLHNQSAIHITLLDSFGDYYDLYWDNDSSYFYQTKQELFLFKYSETAKTPKIDLKSKIITIYTQNQINNYYPRKTTSVLVAVYFYYLFIYFYLKVEKNKKKFFILPFLGLTLLLMHIISGFPQNNFDPLIGDTLKPLYYSFFIAISFSFAISELVRNKIQSFLLLIIFISSFMFIYGFPKDYSNNNFSKVVERSNFSELCSLNYNLFKFEKEFLEFKTCNNTEEPRFTSFNYENSRDFKYQPKIILTNGFLKLLSLFSISYLFFEKPNLSREWFFNRFNKRI